MQISLNWIKDFIDLSDVTVEDVVAKLTMCGLEVESCVDKNKVFENFVVGYVEERIKHPNADKLSVCKVSTGDTVYQVVCGAPNVAAGMKIVFAKEGAVVPSNGMQIAKVKLRGVESSGMICSEAELELSNDHSGIMVLPDSLEAGTPIAKALGLDDVVLEIGITPNRPDALSHIGVARDLAAIYNKKLSKPEIKDNATIGNIAEYVSIEVLDSVNCPRYTGKVVVGCKVGPSPNWMKNRLQSAGVRSINNIVDVTNYILMELGQPLHAFDIKKLSRNKIIVKPAIEGEKFVTLDSTERVLNSKNLLICDSEKGVAVAGVMGGENSEVSDETTDVLIESAYFHPSSVRKTAKQLQLSTESSYRFERGTDAGNTDYAAERAAQLLVEVAGGTIISGIIDIKSDSIQPKEVELRFARIGKILGYDINKDSVVDILNNLGLTVVSVSEDKLKCIVPLFRPDIEREIDLIEEVARIHGYDNIPAVERIKVTLQERIDESANNTETRKVLTGLGFDEIISNTLISDKMVALSGNPIALLNPQSVDMANLRTSLIPGALDIVKKNIYAGERNIKIFEIGRIFNKNIEGEIKTFEDFTETESLLILITGKLDLQQWNQTERNSDIYDLKGYIKSFLGNKRLDYLLNDNYNEVENNLFDLAFTKNYQNQVLGIGGKVKKEVTTAFDIEQDVYCFEINCSVLNSLMPEKKQLKPLLRYPKSKRDFAFIFDDSIMYSEIEKCIIKSSTGLLKKVELFDIFTGEAIGQGKKSMAIALEFYDTNRTLTDEEVEKEFNRLIDAVKKEFNATLRGN